MVQRALRILCGLGLLVALAFAWHLGERPLEPGLLGGLLRADALSAFFSLLLLAVATEMLGRAGTQPLRLLLQLGLLGASLFVTHLGLIAVLFVGANLLSLRQDRELSLHPALQIGLSLLPSLLLGIGLGQIGLATGLWSYHLPGVGAGLQSGAFICLLVAVFLAAGFAALPGARLHGPLRELHPLLAVGFFYPLLRLYSLGPWNTGWLLATLLLGSVASLWAAWYAASNRATPEDWICRAMLGLAIIGAGLGSGAGLALTCFALLCLPLLRLGLQPQAQGPAWLGWALCAALPLALPFVTTWIGVAAATAGGLQILAILIWASALLLAVPVIRGLPMREAETELPVLRRWLGNPRAIAALLSLALGIGSPALLTSLINPLVAQLQSGLTPFGEVRLWPWAGLIAYDSASQSVATLPSFALLGLMLILAALLWLGQRLRSMFSARQS